MTERYFFVLRTFLIFRTSGTGDLHRYLFLQIFRTSRHGQFIINFLLRPLGCKGEKYFAPTVPGYLNTSWTLRMRLGLIPLVLRPSNFVICCLLTSYFLLTTSNSDLLGCKGEKYFAPTAPGYLNTSSALGRRLGL